MFIRLVFWSAERPQPRVIATGTGHSLESAMAGCFAPINDKAWKREYRDGKLFLRRGKSGYCGEIVKVRDPNAPRERLSLPVARQRLTLPVPRQRLSLEPVRKREKL